MFDWADFLLYAMITAVTPGPNNIMSMTHAARLGFKRSLTFNLGIWAGFSAVMIGCTFLCSLLSSLIPRIKLPMLILGALYMLWLAWKTLRSSGGLEAGAAKSGFLSGLVLQFMNPKIYLYCIVSMEAYILPYFNGRPVVLLGFALLLAFIGFAFTLCWSAFGSFFRLIFSKHARIVNIIMALLLVYCAVSLFI